MNEYNRGFRECLKYLRNLAFVVKLDGEGIDEMIQHIEVLLGDVEEKDD